jgi:hypothetical protein
MVFSGFGSFFFGGVGDVGVGFSAFFAEDDFPFLGDVLPFRPFFLRPSTPLSLFFNFERLTTLCISNKKKLQEATQQTWRVLQKFLGYGKNKQKALSA